MWHISNSYKFKFKTYISSIKHDKHTNITVKCPTCVSVCAASFFSYPMHVWFQSSWCGPKVKVSCSCLVTCFNHSCLGCRFWLFSVISLKHARSGKHHAKRVTCFQLVIEGVGGSSDYSVLQHLHYRQPIHQFATYFSTHTTPFKIFWNFFSC